MLLNTKNPIKTVIFDFDGTIADTLAVGIAIINRHSAYFGIRKIDKRDVRKLKKLPLMSILKEFEIALIKVPFLLKFFRSELAKEIDSILPFDGVVQALRNLKSKGYRLGILSSNSVDNVTSFLKNNDLEIFDFVWSENTLFGKQRALKKILKVYELSASEVLYIGDEVRDIEGAKKAGVASGAVTWGYNDEELLLEHEPDVMFNSPQDLLSRV
jgi:HAD superfamily hydrolase (TIGR01662 family)